MLKKTTRAKVFYRAFFAVIALFLLFLPLVFATSHLPKGLLVAEEYNKQKAAEFLKNISFIIAFVAGMITLLSPCILPLLPAYFAITFKEKRRMTLHTLIFFLGFTLIFSAMGILATIMGKSLATLFEGMQWLIFVAGGVFILLGVMTFVGKGFSGMVFQRKSEDDKLGVFLLGLFFAMGWTACIGPILAGVVLMASTFGNYLTTVYLMFFYSLGIFMPLFILSFFYDKIPLQRISKINKPLRIFRVHTTLLNTLGGLMFILLGLIFIFFKGTGVINQFQMFGLKPYFYSLQNAILDNTQLISVLNIAGFIFLAIFVFFLVYFLRKEMKNKADENDKKTHLLEVKHE